MTREEKNSSGSLLSSIGHFLVNQLLYPLVTFSGYCIYLRLARLVLQLCSPFNQFFRRICHAGSRCSDQYANPERLDMIQKGPEQHHSRHQIEEPCEELSSAHLTAIPVKYSIKEPYVWTKYLAARKRSGLGHFLSY